MSIKKNIFAPLAKGLCGAARRAAVMLLVMMLTMTAQTAWAEQWATSLSGNATDGWYINMPAKGTAKTIDNAAVLDLSSSDITSFKLYDDGGKDGNYPNNYSGYLVITAPTGYLLQLSGSITTWTYDKLTVWDGTDTSDDSKKLLNGVSSSPTDTKTAITTVTSTGNVITVYFNSISNNAGLDLTVKIVSPYALEDATITGVESWYRHTGSAISITPTVKNAGGTTLTAGTHYTVTITNSSNETVTDVIAEGDYTLTVTAKDGSGYTGSQSVSFTVSEYPGLSIDNDYSKGQVGYYYVNMPAKGTAKEFENAAQLDLSSLDVTSFKLYDDGGKDGNYSDYYDGYLVITAPEGTTIRLSGRITTSDAYLSIWDCNGSDSDKKILNNLGGNDINIVTYANSQYRSGNEIVSTGNVMTIYFHSSYATNTGFDITVKIGNPYDLQYATISGVESHHYDYTGSAISITPTVKDVNGTTLTAGTHYTVTIKNSSNETVTDVIADGDYTLTVTGTGDYTGSKSVSFSVVNHNVTLSGNATDGWYIDMPAKGRAETFEHADLLSVPSGIATFKLYDDGGKDDSYSWNYTGYLVITAPEGSRINLKGSADIDSRSSLTVYDGNGTSGTKLLDAVTGRVNDINQTSANNTITVYFNSSISEYRGFNLTVTVYSSTPLAINIADNITNGSVTAKVNDASVSSAVAGTTVTLAATPADGYVLSGFTVTDSESNDVEVDGGTWYNNNATFTMPVTPVNVDASFMPNSDLSVTIPREGVKVVALTDDKITSFSVYDNGGKDSYYSYQGDGYVVISAPTGYIFKAVGTLKTKYRGEYVTFYQGDYRGTGDAPAYYGSKQQYGGSDIDVSEDIDFLTTGNVMTIYFHTTDGGGDGLDLTVTLIEAVTEHAVTVNNPDPANGCTVTADLASATFGTTVTLTVSTADGYQFDGITAKDAENNDVTLTPVDDTHYTFKMGTTDVTVTPTFSTVTYTITYVLGDEAVTFTPAATTYTVETDDITLGTPEWTGHTFAGWYDNSGFTGDAVTTLAKGSFGNKTYYAQWTDNAYTVAFDKNASDATGTMDAQAFTYGTAQTLTANAYSRPGYAFNGWNTQANGSGTDYTDQQEVSNLTTEAGATVTLYAQWTLTEWGADVAADGTQEKPYLIRTTHDLDLLAQRVNAGETYNGKYFQLGNDIDYADAPKNYDSGKSNYVTIGKDYDHSFRGHFDGKGHTISGIVIDNSNDTQGLFGVVFGSTEVKNIKLSNCSITGKDNVGAIAGQYYHVSITNCYVDETVTVTGGEKVGGIVGYNYDRSPLVEYCVSAASVSGTKYVGGIVGYTQNTGSGGTVRNNLYTGTSVTTTDGYNVGAIVGADIDNNNFANNYYRMSGIKGRGTTTTAYSNRDDITANDGAVPGYYVTLSGKTISISGSGATINVYGPDMAVEDTYRVFASGREIIINREYRTGLDFDGYDANVIIYSTDNYYQKRFTMPTNDVTISEKWLLSLANAGDNAANISTYNSETLSVKLTDRTLYKDGKWNTLCLPFDVDLTATDCPLYGATARSLTAASVSGTTLNLTFGDAVNTLEAGTPYIIKWDGDGTSNIENPVFNGVTIDATKHDYDTNAESVTTDERVRFVGTYKSTAFDAENKSILLMGGENTLYYPAAGAGIGAQRAYFKIGDDDNALLARRLTAFSIDFGEDEEEATGIISVSAETRNNADGWYSLDGRKLVGKPTQNGIYINNGKKVIIK